MAGLDAWTYVALLALIAVVAGALLLTVTARRWRNQFAITATACGLLVFLLGAPLWAAIIVTIVLSAAGEGAHRAARRRR